MSFEKRAQTNNFKNRKSAQFMKHKCTQTEKQLKVHTHNKTTTAKQKNTRKYKYTKIPNLGVIFLKYPKDQ